MEMTQGDHNINAELIRHLCGMRTGEIDDHSPCAVRLGHEQFSILIVYFIGN